MGPHRAAEIFGERTKGATSYRVTLYGSLAATGKGHFTDKTIIDALSPKPVEILWKPEIQHEFHTNAMLFEAFHGQDVIDKWKIYSIGGGELADEHSVVDHEEHYEENSMTEIVKIVEKYGMNFWEYVEKHEDSDIWDYLSERWKTMQCTIEKGLQDDGVLPGGLLRKAEGDAVLCQGPQLQGLIAGPLSCLGLCLGHRGGERGWRQDSDRAHMRLVGCASGCAVSPETQPRVQ